VGEGVSGDRLWIPGDKVTVLAPGAASHFFGIGAERVRRRAPGRAIRLLFVGGDFDRKGGPLLLEAARAMSTREPFELHLVTGNPFRAPRRHRPPRRAAEQPIAPSPFQGGRRFVLPSNGECLSVALMEAGAAGLPIVATDVGALGEAARHGENALVVPTG
jgi:glycosyltransferase involved in cell wall biosynthesis